MTPAVDTFPLPLNRIVTRAFGPRGGFRSPGVEIIRDLAAAYGVPFPAQRYATDRRTTFTEMVADLVDELTEPDDPVGLVVLAHAVPDAETGWPACYLATALPADPMAFAVADQGVVTPFTALRIAAAQVRARNLTRAVVLILDQTVLLRDPAADADPPTPTENRVVALTFGRPGAVDRPGTGGVGGRDVVGRLSVELTPAVTPPRADELLPELIAAAGIGADHRLVLGGGLADHVAAAAAGTGTAATTAAAAATVAPAGLPGTGTWATLASQLDTSATAGARAVTIVDYDSRLSILARSTIDLAR
ncbi:hypothetical protein O7632_22805 [Solwaraspora sp. WMMD406]|uniref:hypothetical protein n=1 Tax=Solwaraspora sp. WMMD406 TaxID=3016095 RepID=UPI002416D2B3|nr:hypothetical protein [Solwaraspora sp. WMMD406]MDG4766907.1 hypothetical protein [Solwaraspora sp. WMMD406]